MSLTQVFKSIVDVLWDIGGIGAFADLGLEHFGPGADCPDLAEGCPARCSCENIPLEDEPCHISCPGSGLTSGPSSCSRH
ncbi:MAG: hypothetical protein KKF77_12165 [Proteobacteria bacterium]|nr:hypothetical protein [Pseudomonadota bacterium]